MYVIILDVCITLADFPLHSRDLGFICRICCVAISANNQVAVVTVDFRCS